MSEVVNNTENNAIFKNSLITELKEIAKVTNTMRANSLKIRMLFIIFLSIMFNKIGNIGFCILITFILALWNAYYLNLAKGYKNWYDEVKRRRLALDYTDCFEIKPYNKKFFLYNALCPTIWGFYGITLIIFIISAGTY